MDENNVLRVLPTMQGPSQLQMKPGCLATKYMLQIWLRVLVTPIPALPCSSGISDPGSSNLLISAKELDLSPRHSWLLLWDSSLFQSQSHPVLLRLGCQNLTFRQLEQRQRNVCINKKWKLFRSLNAISDIKFDSPGIWREERKDRFWWLWSRTANLWLLTLSAEKGSAQEMEVAVPNEGLQRPSWV